MRESVSSTTTSGGKERAISLHEGDLVDLAQRGLSRHHFPERRFAEEQHSFFFCSFLDFRGRTAVENHGSDTVGEVEKFRDRGATMEAGAVAVDAAGAFPEFRAAELLRIESRLGDEGVRIRDLVAARVADFAHQPLRQDAVERRDEVVEIDLHVQEAAENVDDVVGVNGGEDEVAGERRLHGDGGRLFVADLADHDLVGVVAKDGAQSARKRQPLLLIHRNLRDSSELVFDRVLDRDDFVFRSLNLGKCGVKRRRFAGAGRTGDEHHSVRLFDELAELEEHLLVEAEDVEAQALEVGVHRLLVQDTDDRILAVRGGDDGDAEVDGAAGDAQLEAAVLRDAFLGDVELRHDLDARNDGAVVALVDRIERFVEHAVDAVLDDDFVVSRLDVNVRGAALDGVEDDGVDQLDDRRRLLLR